jgi:uncharacterized protein (TIGR02271 family)
MQRTYGNEIQTGTTVYSSDGEKIGDVAGVADNYFVIEKGFIFTKDIYVPMSAVSSADDDGINLSLTKDEVENQDWSSQPQDDLGDRTTDAYVGETDTGFATRDTGYASSDSATNIDRDVLERREEQLNVDTQAEKAGEVHVGKHVVEEQQAVDVPVTREEVTIDRRSVDRPATGEALTEDSIDVPVYEERVEASKEARVVEELEVGKTATTDTQRVQDTVRREEFDIDDETGTTRRDR